jgi:hypothetical protein
VVRYTKVEKVTVLPILVGVDKIVANTITAQPPLS